MYTEAFPKDRWGIKAVVWVVFLLETVFTIFMTIAAWNQYGDGWGDVDSLLIIDWSWEPLPALNGVLAGLAQGFYIWRIWSLTNKLWLPFLISLVSIMQVVVSFYYGIAVTVEGLGVDKLIAHSAEVSLWLAGSATCDILITISLVVILSRRKAATRFSQTAGLLTRLIRFAVETGSITSAGAIIEVVLWLTMHQYNIHFIFFLVLGKLYSNMLMATLNCRAAIFQQDPTTTTPSQMSSFWMDASDKRTQSISARTVSNSRAVNITKDIVTDRTDDTIVMTDFRNNEHNSRKGGLLD
ncbi:hypothetical protein K435DRAFT_964429 [Dendrothele bispora CBS 962.96]|uniref:DUF6534 domain-containing protein n=1 Tax=Dendrothele bispora (strain CBS 962.96) TaxID=1314807 RepID=A0A4S8MBP7_DENBC|nr:hypothetical protein K435DRAFT_964429 [Dendrothele bispora CBS 962.96]